jgi:hypothetical protein
MVVLRPIVVNESKYSGSADGRTIISKQQSPLS